MPFTNEQKRKAAEREAAMRATFYPGRVQRGGMKKEQATYELAIMQEIANDYRKLEQADAGKGT